MTPPETFAGITKDTFERMEPAQKLDVLFDLLVDSCGNCKVRIDRLEKRRAWDSMTSGAFGFLGGFVAVLSQKIK